MMFRPPVTDSPWTLLGVYYFVLLRPKPREQEMKKERGTEDDTNDFNKTSIDRTTRQKT